MINYKIGFIGVGAMGGAIVDSILNSKQIDKSKLFLSNIDDKALLKYKNNGIFTTCENKKVVEISDIVFLAVKPQQANDVLLDISSNLSKDTLLISIIAGKSISFFKKNTNENQPIVRIMPNLCAKVCESYSVWVASKEVSPSQKNTIKEIISSFGKEKEFFSEDKIDISTAIAGSGPAYIFYIAEIMEKVAIENGFSIEEAKEIVEQTIYGAICTMKNEKHKTKEDLRKDVTSKGGTTEQAMSVLFRENFADIFSRAINSAYKRAKELQS